MCLRLFPQFSGHLDKACYTISLLQVDVHDIYCMRPGLGVQEVCSFFPNSSISIKRVFVSQIFLEQLSSHLADIVIVCLIASDKTVLGS